MEKNIFFISLICLLCLSLVLAGGKTNNPDPIDISKTNFTKSQDIKPEKISLSVIDNPKDISKQSKVMDFQLLQNTYLCAKHCEAIINITKYDTSKISSKELTDKSKKENFYANYTKLDLFSLGLESVDYFISDNSTNNTFQLIKYPEDLIDKKGNYLLKIKGEKYLNYNKYGEIKPNNLDWILTFYSIPLDSWATWLSPPKVYDEIDDSLINSTLWVNSSYGAVGTKQSYVSEGVDSILLFTYVGNGFDGGMTAWINSTNLTNISKINNLTTRVVVGGMSAHPDSNIAVNSYFMAFGTVIKQISGETTATDDSVWTFNRTSTDPSDNHFTVWDDGVNYTIINATDNYLYVYNHLQKDRLTYSISVNNYIYYVYYSEIDTLYSNLSTPNNNSIETTVLTNFICNQSSSAGKLFNSTLELWWTNGTLLLTNTTNITGYTNSTTFSYNLANETFLWNCLVFNNEGLSTSDGNRTVINDKSYPTVVINSISVTTGSQTIIFNSSETDTNLDKCKYTIFNSSGMIDGANVNRTFTCNAAISATTTITPPATFTLRVYANDTTGNENYREQNFTTIFSPGGSPGGGGGGSTVINVSNISLVITPLRIDYFWLRWDNDFTINVKSNKKLFNCSTVFPTSGYKISCEFDDTGYIAEITLSTTNNKVFNVFENQLSFTSEDKDSAYIDFRARQINLNGVSLFTLGFRFWIFLIILLLIAGVIVYLSKGAELKKLFRGKHGK